MHDSSFYVMHLFVEKYIKPRAGAATSVFDVGSRDVNGSFRPLFEIKGCGYRGLDIEPGLNVDIVAEKPYSWPVLDGAYDIVISGSCLEHVEAPWLWIREIARVVRSGGLVCVIAPWRWPEHRHPVDCWRILPDGMRFLFSWADLEEIECGIRGNDCYGIARKR